jgi:acetyl/propionyl-CoA carboxylase alpha subunit
MQAKVNDKTYEIELVSKEGNNVQIMLNGKIIDLDVVMSEDGFCSLLYEGRSYNAESVKHSEGKYTITTDFKHFDIELPNPQKKYLRNRNRDIDEVQESIASPMPGKIIKVMVEENQKVQKGDALLVIEAMKMQSTYTTAQDAEVEKIAVSEGDSVLRDQLLISFKRNKK